MDGFNLVMARSSRGLCVASFVLAGTKTPLYMLKQK